MTPPTLGLLLAGGLARRMGGGDKPLRTIAGRSILAHVIERLAPQCDGLLVNANGDPGRFADFGLPVLADTLPDHPGPLAGVLAGMEWAADQGADAIISVAADTPFFPHDLVTRLMAARGPSGLVLAASPDASGRMQRQPTFGLWPVALRHDLNRALGAGLRKIVLWTEAHHATTAEFSALPFDPFFNVNSPEDINAANMLVSK